MCISCVQENMILNDQYTKPSTVEQNGSNKKERKENNNNIVKDKINSKRTEDADKPSDSQPETQITKKDSTSPREEEKYPQNKKNKAPQTSPKKTFHTKDLLLAPKDNKFLLVPPSHLPDLPSDLVAAKKMKRSFSFGGFGVFTTGASFSGVTKQELESMFDPVCKKEPSKLSKTQIKEYAQKYKHVETEKTNKTPWYKDPLEYSQPAHLVSCIAIIYLGFRLFPDSRRSPVEASTLTRLLYVSSVSAVFGAQFWMTFISGLALFFSVPRYMFAKVQSVLFPLYFLTNAGLMLVTIITYTQHRPTHLWDTHQLIQGVILVFDFIVNLGIRLYLAPILTKLITIKVAIETEAGIGTEVGSNQPGLLSRCPHYMRLHKAFRRTHVIIAIGNMASMAGTSFHLYYLATKLCSYHL